MCEELGICNNDTMPTIQKLTVEARGVNATALEKDIGTVGHLLNVDSCVLFCLLCICCVVIWLLVCVYYVLSYVLLDFSYGS